MATRLTCQQHFEMVDSHWNDVIEFNSIRVWVGCELFNDTALDRRPNVATFNCWVTARHIQTANVQFSWTSLEKIRLETKSRRIL